jgi:hypothetical protein
MEVKGVKKNSNRPVSTRNLLVLNIGMKERKLNVYNDRV